MTVSDPPSELRPAYRTLSEPTLLLGVALSGWLAILAAAALGYGWLALSPLPWRLNASLVVIGLGAPLALLLLREASAISPARLLGAAVRWRTRPSRISGTQPAVDGAIRLTASPAPVPETSVGDELPWLDAGAGS